MDNISPDLLTGAGTVYRRISSEMMHIRPLRGVAVGLLLVVITFFSFYFGLGSYPLLDNNEGLYAEIPREMITSGDYILPHLNNLPYVEKPPMLYWLVALSYHVFGVNEFAARFVPATAGVLTGAVLIWFLLRLGLRSVSLVCGLMWATSFGVIALSRTILFDMLLTFFITVALMCVYVWMTERRPLYLHVAYVALALAILTKGLVALALTGLTVAVFSFVVDRSLPLFSPKRVRTAIKILSGLLNPVSVFLFLAITVPWHVLAAHEDKGFLWFYFINEHVLRFLGLREPHDYHTDPFYHYLPWIAAYLFPWSLLMPAWLFRHLRTPRTAASSEDTNRFLRRFLWSWFLALLVFFSSSTAKSDYYMITGVPPLVVLLALGIQPYLKYFRGRLLVIVSTVVASVTIAVLMAENYHGLLSAFGVPPFIKLIDRRDACTLIGFAIPGVILSWLTYRRWPLAMTCCTLAVLWIAGITTVVEVARRNADAYSSKDVIAAIEAQQPEAQIFMYSSFESRSTVPFYAKQALTIVDSSSPVLRYGQKTAAGSHLFMTLAEFLRLPPTSSRYLIVSNKAPLRELQSKTYSKDLHLWKTIGHTIIYTAADLPP